MTRGRLAVSMLAVVLVALGGIWLIGGRAARDGASSVAFSGDLRPGGHLETLTVPLLEGPGSIEYASLRDRPVVLNFFASWCPSCIAEMPAFEQVHRAASDRAAFLGVSQSDARGASIELARTTGVTYVTAYDRGGDFFAATGAIGMPTTIFIRPGGDIAHVYTGALDATALTALIEEHLGVRV